MTTPSGSVLASYGSAPPGSLSLQREEGANSHLLCVLDGILLGIEALAVREMLPLPLITPLREAPPQVAGVANVRGALVPVIDVRFALGLPPRTARTSDVLVIMERSGEFAALIVSEVCDVRALQARPLENGPMMVSSGAGLVAGLAPIGDEIVQLLRIEALLHLGQAHRPPGFEGEEFEAFTAESAGARSLFDGIAPDQREVFAARARALSCNLEDGQALEKASGRAVAAFALGGEFFGLDLRVVHEFSPLRALAPVPCTPPYIAGLMNLRGETLTLIDIGPSLGLPPTVVKIASSKVVVTFCEGLRLGLLVDEVLDIVSVGDDDVASASVRVASKIDSEILCDVVFFRDKMLGIIDLPRLLHSDILETNQT